MARLFQASTVSALEKGHYDYTISIEYFLRNGDTGIGTYNGHNGEAIFLDGIAYNGCASGEVKIMDYPQTGITFGAITKFENEVPEIQIQNISDLETLKKLLNEQCQSMGPNYFYVAKICGHFNQVTVTSSYKQRKPFRPLSIVRKEMRSYTYKDLDGVLVGVYAPKYIGDISFNGWCFHFLSKDKLKGGKVVEVESLALKVKINSIDKWEIKLSNSKGFITESFGDEKNEFKIEPSEKSLEKVEPKVDSDEASANKEVPLKPVEKPIQKVEEKIEKKVEAKIVSDEASTKIESPIEPVEEPVQEKAIDTPKPKKAASKAKKEAEVEDKDKE